MLPETEQISDDDRIYKLRSWLNTCLPNDTVGIAPVQNDASFRRYFRVTAGEKTLIAMDTPTDKIPLEPFLTIAQQLQQLKLNVPDIYHYSLSAGFALMRDLGTCSYLMALNNKTADSLYHQAMQALFILQNRGKTNTLPLFDREFITFELSLFKDWFLDRHLSIKLTPAEEDSLQSIFVLLTNTLLEQPFVFMHRDFHSRNLMFCTDNNPGILDFQDAMKGPITYDLVSLLRDSYITWPENRVYTWAETYYERLRTANRIHVDLQQFFLWFDLTGLQRHLKILGIFSRLYHRDNKPAYLKNIPATFQYIKYVCNKYKTLKTLLELLYQWDIEKRISP